MRLFYVVLFVLYAHMLILVAIWGEEFGGVFVFVKTLWSHLSVRSLLGLSGTCVFLCGFVFNFSVV